MLFWRASDPNTGVALNILENLRPYLEFIDVVCMHTPKFDGERQPRFVQLSAKYHEMNFPYGADTSLHLWRELGVTLWPTAVVLSPRSKRVLFAFEGHQSLPRMLPCVRAAIDFYFPRRVAAQPPPEPTLRLDQLPTGQSFRLEARCDAFPISAAALRELLENRRRALAAIDAPIDRKEQRGPSRQSKRSQRKKDSTSSGAPVAPRSPLPPQDVYGRQILALLDTSRQALSLRFPGKVDVHAESDRLFIADSGHHRILITKLSGEFIEQIGGRQGAGFRDGSFAEALFEYPQGLVFDPLSNRLVIADSSNDAIRIASFTDRTVTTVSIAPLITEAERRGVADTDKKLQGRTPNRQKTSPSTNDHGSEMYAQIPVWAWQRRWYTPYRTPGSSTSQRPGSNAAHADKKVLANGSNSVKQHSSSGSGTNVASPSGVLPTMTTGARSRFRLPWDVSMHAGSVYVAVAGSHQVWRLDSSGILREYRGSGRPALIDDSDASQAPVSFASPHGLCALGTCLYVADSESSTVRTIDLRAHWTKTILGGNIFFLENLSTFGDRDGWGRGGHLQYPCGCCALPDGQLLLTDTLNHKIKLLNLEVQDSRTLAGSGEPGLRDGAGSQASFFAPQGIAYDPTVRMAFVADTYNHCIRQIDVATGVVRTLTLTPPAILETFVEQQSGGVSVGR
jgi:DNA-binding beta-propeller fold protein YncE